LRTRPERIQSLHSRWARSSSSRPWSPIAAANRQQELDLEYLSSIARVLNDRFGTDLSEVDKLLLDQFEEDWVADGELSDQA
jgi:hypothetical protein